jgi:energy-coupling factor transport system ATP-binding protein
MSIVSASDINFSYDGKNPTLKHISFTMDEGEYVCLIGHNGSGKSTLAKILAGLLSDFEGSLTMFGTKVDEKAIKQVRPHLGIVFQNPDNQFVGTSVRDDIAFGLENRCVPQKEMDGIINEFASLVGMQDYLDASPENLSGGQKQRVAIAGVLAMGPDLLILDEATAMLDPLGKTEILDLVAKTRERNPKLAVLSITHDIEEAARADKVMVMNAGEIILSGPASEVFSHQKELEAIHLGSPFAVSLINALRKEGVEIPPEITELDDLEAYLCR